MKDKDIVRIDTIKEYNDIVNKTTDHPLISLFDFSKLAPVDDDSRERAKALIFGFYLVFLKQGAQCNIKYGRKNYDYQEGSLVFIGPEQMVSLEGDGEDYQPSGHALLFHPDLLIATPLAKNIKNYSFFSYDLSEALHLSDDEKQEVFECFNKIARELKKPVDKHSRKLIVANIELFLNYCVRFYDRQFITRDIVNIELVEKFTSLLYNYFSTDIMLSNRIPTVSYFANELHLSPNYFGDLIKKETGKTPLEHIQNKVLEVAKEKILESGRPISEIAYELGFSYPQHFTRFFKQQTGQTPGQYRGLN